MRPLSLRIALACFAAPLVGPLSAVGCGGSPGEPTGSTDEGYRCHHQRCGGGDSGAGDSGIADSGAGESAASDSRTADTSAADSGAGDSSEAADSAADTASPPDAAVDPCAPNGGTTYYVAPSGSDSNPGTVTSPFQTLNHGASVLAPGDTLCVRAGTYAEWLDDAIPGGTSWGTPVTVAAYAGETVVLQPGPGAGWVLHFTSSTSHYIVIDGLVMDASNVTYDGVKITSGSLGASHHIRIQNSEVMHSQGQGILVTDNASGVQYNEFLNLKVHDNGTVCSGMATRDFCHGFYIATSHNLVDGCEVYRNAGWGVHIYEGNTDQTSYTVVRNNRIHDNAAAGLRGPGMVLSSGVGDMAYNNVVWNNNGGIEIAYSVDGAQVFDNTVVSNTANGGWWGIQNFQSTNTTIENNIVYGQSTPIDDSAGATLTANFTSDPLFVNAAAFDFQLQSASGAIGAGVNLTGLGIVGLDVDVAGTPRPASGAWDVGAYEHMP